MKRLPVWVKSLLIAYVALGAISGTAEAAFHLTRANGSTEPTKGLNFLPEITGIRTSPAPRLAPQRASGTASGPSVTIVEPASKWDCIAQKESGGRWSYNGPSGYDGGLQFLPSTWNSARDSYNRSHEQDVHAAYAHQASKDEQIAVAEHWLGQTSWGQWPNTSRACGYR